MSAFIGNVTNQTIQFLDPESGFVTVKKVGIANNTPQNTLDVGSSLSINDTGANVLTIRGNVGAEFFTGDASKMSGFVMTDGLDRVALIGTETLFTMNLHNSEVSFITAPGSRAGISNANPLHLVDIGSNVFMNVDSLYVSGNTQVLGNVISGDGVIATYLAGDGNLLTNTTTITTMSTITARGNVTTNTIQFMNTTTSFITTGPVSVRNTEPENTLDVATKFRVDINSANVVVVDGVVVARGFIGDGSKVTDTISFTQLEQMVSVGNTTSNTVQFANVETALVCRSNVGILNANPMHNLDVGANLYVDDAAGFNSILNVTGNVSATYFIGDGRFMSNVPVCDVCSTLEYVTNRYGNSTANTVRFVSNSLSLYSESNVGIANEYPIHSLDIGSNIYIEDRDETTMNTLGNIQCNYMIGDGSRLINLPSTLNTILNSGNVTDNICSFTHSSVGISVGANIQFLNDIIIDSPEMGSFYIGPVKPDGALHALGLSNSYRIGIGYNAGQKGQADEGIAIGVSAGMSGQRINSIGIGYQAGQSFQNSFAVGIGESAGFTYQGSHSFAIGFLSGKERKNVKSHGVGSNSGVTNQGESATALGDSSGYVNQGVHSTSVGYRSGMNDQGSNSMAMGAMTSQYTQGANAFSMGFQAGQSTQGDYSYALGLGSGVKNQGDMSMSIGSNSGYLNQGSNCFALGQNTSLDNQQDYAFTVGVSSGSTSQGIRGFSLGQESGMTSQNQNTFSMGNKSGMTGQSIRCFALGEESGMTSQSQNAFSLGHKSGMTAQGVNGFAFGQESGMTSQGKDAFSLGHKSGMSGQGSTAFAIGHASGMSGQASGCFSLGHGAGQTSQQLRATAVGYNAGMTSQKTDALALGYGSGRSNQGIRALAVGYNAALLNQGNDGISIGFSSNSGANSISLGTQTIANGTETISIGRLAKNDKDNSILFNLLGTPFSTNRDDAFFINSPKHFAFQNNESTLLSYQSVPGEIITNQLFSFSSSGNVLITGNLEVIGGVTSITTGSFVVSDSIVLFGNNNTLGTLDLGIIFYRGGPTKSNVAFGYDESIRSAVLGYSQSTSLNDTITIDMSNNFTINVYGSTTFSNVIEVAKNKNQTSVFSYASVGYTTGFSDTATFSHIDMNSSTKYALRQSSTGTTFLNAATGQRIGLAINNSEQLVVHPSGNVTIGSTTAQNYKLYVNGITYFNGYTEINGEPTFTNASTLNGDATVTNQMFVGNDTDNPSHIGRAVIGYCGDIDLASFAHIDSNTTTGYALRQNSIGATMLNSPSGQYVSFRLNNSDQMVLHSTGNMTIGTATTQNYKLHVEGDMNISGFYHDSVNKGFLVYLNSIIMWSGTTIPTGWSLCNGSNGTPDLRDRFIVGSGSSYTVGATGGAASVTLTTTEMPSHTHGHNFTGTAATAGAHTHNYNSRALDRGKPGTSGARMWSEDNNNTSTTTEAGGHSHTITLSGTINNTGSGAAHENRPPYYALSYIMRLDQ